MKNRTEHTYRAFYSILLFLIITSALFLPGCSSNLEASFHGEAKHSLNLAKKSPGIGFLGGEILPIQYSAGEEFYKASSWLNDSSMLYIANKNDGRSLLYSYNLTSGKSDILFESDVPIISADASPGKNMILVHTSASNEGQLTIIDTKGKELFSTNIQSYELTFQWNPFNEDLLVISTFTEEWDFTTFLWDLQKNDLKKLTMPEPFLRWISKDELVYQKWDEEGISLQAPLYSVSIQDGKTSALMNEVFQFDSFGKYLLTVGIDEEANPGLGQYKLFKDARTPAASIDAQLLTSYSGWMVPFYDLIDGGKEFLYLRAVHQGEADLYEEGFDLIKTNLDSLTEDLIFSGLSNEPLSCAPSGELCLYGFQFEKVLNLKTKEIVELVQ